MAVAVATIDQNPLPSANDVSSYADSNGWSGKGGYRIQDSADQAIGYGGWTAGAKLVSGTPTVFVLDTSTMKIVNSSASASNALSAVQSINSSNTGGPLPDKCVPAVCPPGVAGLAPCICGVNYRCADGSECVGMGGAPGGVCYKPCTDDSQCESGGWGTSAQCALKTDSGTRCAIVCQSGGSCPNGQTCTSSGFCG